jgi:hypothetical protein
MHSIISTVFSDSVENEVYTVFAFMRTSGVISGIVGDHQIMKYMIGAQNKQAAVTVLILQWQTLTLL